MEYDALLESGGFQKGENSRDEPTELASGQWAEIVNLIPGDESARPRGGCTTTDVVDGAGYIDWVFAFRSNKARKHIIGKRFSDLVSVEVTGGISVIKAGAFPVDSAQPAAVRVGDSVIVTCDYPTGTNAISVSEKNGTLVAQPANILRAGATSLTITALPVDAPAEGEAVTAKTFPRKSSRMICATYVRRDDSFATDTAGRPITTSTWGDASAESWEDIEERAFLEGLDEDGVAIHVISLSISSPPDGATHVRLWVTQLTEWDAVGSKTAAMQVTAGATRRYLRDISLRDFPASYTFSLDKTEGELAGQTHLSDTLGVNEVPPARVLKYHNGLLWATGAQFGDSPGRSYYSYPMSGNPTRRLTQFNLSDKCIDTSLDDSERTMGMCASRGHLFFINENDVWILRNGDPSNAPEIIAQGMGTTFPQTIVERGQVAFYLSNQGPAMISGETVELIEEFTHSAVWPKPSSGRPSFFNLTKAERKNVRAWWYQDNLFVSGWTSDGVPLCAALRVKENANAGPWTMQTAPNSGVKLENFAWFNDNEAYLVSDGPEVDGEVTTGIVSRFLGTKSLTDGNGFFYTASVTARALRVDRRRSWRVGEALFILGHASWLDVGQLMLTLRGQFGRVGSLFKYEQRPITEPHQNTNVNNLWREQILQAVPAGRVGTWFQPGATKVVRGEFTIEGLDVALIAREGHEWEYVSLSKEEMIPQLDTGLAIFDDRFNGGNDG